MSNYEFEKELKPSLGLNEALIWTGKPKQGIILRNSDIFLIPFSLLWGGFAFFWESTVLLTDAPFFFKLWGIPFVVVGLYITIGRFFIDAKRRSNTIYGITPDRIIIKSGVFSMDIKSLNIKTISDITLNQKADNTGTITFGPLDYRSSIMQGFDWPGVKQISRFELIEEVKKVYDKIIEFQRGS
ncbi:PH domain-containing protein [Flavobacterium hungaricum]|uniref:PH domain-containing protein n=1 Tax=Flavobacterium hungaricum TaxID=2082725 RepID=A0ABR9TSD3_9FLAO|nr:PH domain-containing protein [Flavobacterium hungaricum]MBE8727552.1 PH domain-containing protein [Flavobacterium hungaricum]